VGAFCYIMGNMFGITRPTKQPRMVIFDFDGVIIDSLKIIEEYDQWLYPGLTEAEWKDTNYGNYFQKMHPHEHKRRVASEEKFARKREEFFAKKSQARIFPGMQECILGLPKDVICVLNSNSKLGGILPFLKVHNLADRFAFIASKEVSTSKKEKLELVLKKFNVVKKNAVFVTDTIGDLLEGREVGIPVIAVTWGVHTEQDFQDYSPHAVINNVSELSHVLTTPKN
jgi:phosphoglycolate phosphatase